MTTVCVHGLGYVGLPTAAMLANYGHSVVGVDTNPNVLDELRAGNIHFDEPGLHAFVTRALEEGTFEPSNEVVPAKHHLICVPTPFDEESMAADLGYVEAAAEGVVPHLRTGDTVVLESTVPPGTTREVVRPILEGAGLTAGSDFALAHCPETVLPGNVIAELRANDRVIGGINGISAETAIRLYDSFVQGEIRPVSDATTAEFVKLIQNTYRDVNIALANELAKIGADYGIDAREAIDRANRHPRVDLLEPGPGVGGHCLPIDPWFLGRNSEQLDLIASARRVNDGMIDYVIRRLAAELDSLQGRRIAVLGAAYKANVDDTRRSPGLRLARRLTEAERIPQAAVATADGGERVVESTAGAGPAEATDGEATPGIEVAVCDPRVDDPALELCDIETAVTDAAAAVLTVAHDEFMALDPTELAPRMHRPLIFDTRGVIDDAAWTDAGFTVRQL